MGTPRPHELHPSHPLADPAYWKLQWSDEFDACPGGAPDPQKWAFEEGFVRNDELQFYTPDNARCVDGKLTITARYDPVGAPVPEEKQKCRVSKTPLERQGAWCQEWHKHHDADQIHYRSSSLMSRPEDTGMLSYGQYDARIRFDMQQGSWPAWWMTGVPAEGTYHWPQDGEIDILEYHRGELWMCSVYTDGESPEAIWAGGNKKLDPNDEWVSRFHNVTLRWSEQYQDFFLDGVHMQRIVLADLDEKAKPANPYSGAGLLPMIMRFDLAVPKEEAATSDTNWPIVMEVDYVRYFVPASAPPPIPSSAPPPMLASPPPPPPPDSFLPPPPLRPLQSPPLPMPTPTAMAHPTEEPVSPTNSGAMASGPYGPSGTRAPTLVIFQNSHGALRPLTPPAAVEADAFPLGSLLGFGLALILPFIGFVAWQAYKRFHAGEMEKAPPKKSRRSRGVMMPSWGIGKREAQFMRVACAEEEGSEIGFGRDDADVASEINHEPANVPDDVSEGGSDSLPAAPAEPLPPDPQKKPKKLTHKAPQASADPPRVGTLSSLQPNSGPPGCTKRCDDDMASVSSGMTMRPLKQWASAPGARGGAYGPCTMGGIRPRPVFTGNPHATPGMPPLTGAPRLGWAGPQPLPSALPPAVGWTGPRSSAPKPPGSAVGSAAGSSCSMSRSSDPKPPGSAVGSATGSAFSMQSASKQSSISRQSSVYEMDD